MTMMMMMVVVVQMQRKGLLQFRRRTARICFEVQ
jgi:hypothetical protein